MKGCSAGARLAAIFEWDEEHWFRSVEAELPLPGAEVHKLEEAIPELVKTSDSGCDRKEIGEPPEGVLVDLFRVGNVGPNILEAK